MTTLTIKCKIVGVYQDDKGYFVRIDPLHSYLDFGDKKEFTLEIKGDQFHNLKLGDAKLTLEVE